MRECPNCGDCGDGVFYVCDLHAQPVTQYERDMVAKNKCPRCRDSLDTGWECTGCGYDAMPIALAPKADQ